VYTRLSRYWPANTPATICGKPRDIVIAAIDIAQVQAQEDIGRPTDGLCADGVTLKIDVELDEAFADLVEEKTPFAVGLRVALGTSHDCYHVPRVRLVSRRLDSIGERHGLHTGKPAHAILQTLKEAVSLVCRTVLQDWQLDEPRSFSQSDWPVMYPA